MEGTSNVDHAVVFRDDAGEWRWRAVAGNGEIVAQGEAHTREDDAARAASAVFPGITIQRAEVEADAE